LLKLRQAKKSVRAYSEKIDEFTRQPSVHLLANPVLPQTKEVKLKLDNINKIRQKNYGKWYLKPQ